LIHFYKRYRVPAILETDSEMQTTVAEARGVRRRLEARIAFRFPHVSSGCDTSWAV